MSMSDALLKAVLDRIEKKAKEHFRTVREYAGEFTSEEIVRESFTDPAAFVSVLGWQPQTNPNRLTGKSVKRIRVVVFIVTKHADRTTRTRGARQRAELLTGLFEGWSPGIKGLDDGNSLSAENLYNRGADKKGMTIWMLSWWHDISFGNPEQPCSVEAYPDFTGVEIKTEGHVPPVSGNDAPDTDLTYETKINLEKQDEQDNGKD